MSRQAKVIVTVIGVIAGLAAFAFGAYFYFTRQAHPKTSGTLNVDGLQAPVEIVRDEYGVAHIYADTAEDLFFAEGFTHAQERFWQMEFQRRTAAGRLSEIFGETTLETDRYLRHFGFRQSTEEAYAMLDQETQDMIDAYSRGINAYIADRSPAQLGLEFALLGVQGTQWEIEPWTPVDSMIWAYMMIFDQGSRPNQELQAANMIGLLGPERFEQLFPPYRDDRPTIIQSSELDYLSQSADSPLAALNEAELAYLARMGTGLAGHDLVPPLLARMMTPYGSGSNSYVIGGERTATGLPLLGNDPHMGVRMPALWYEVGMHCREKTDACPYNFRGFSLPGVPGILIGHNDRIAWGLTNAAFDAEDVFIERVNPENPDQYEVNGKWVDMDIRREEIKINGREKPEVIFVRSTRNGVVASDWMVDASRFGATDDGTEPYALTFAWTALGPVQSVRAIEMILRAQNWDDFLEATQYFEAGKQNFVYADVDGNIGYVMPGKVPIRAGGDGTVPVPGWNDDFIWTGFIPFEDAPRVFNPAQGFVVTSNNPQVRAEDYPYHIARFPDEGQRAQRITELIEADSDGITVEELMVIQTDNYSISASEIVPYLADLTFDDPAVAAARDRLLGWDLQMDKDSPDAALYNIFWKRLLANTYNDQLPPEYYLDGSGGDSIGLMLPDERAEWWDDVATADIVETRDAILARSLNDAYAEALQTLGDDPAAWRWGDLHLVTFRSDTLGSSGIGVIENIFNRGPFPTSGSEAVPQKTCWNADEDYTVTCIPALRQIIDLSDLNNSRMIHSVGQSGHPMHPHYDDLIDLWINFQYHPSNWDRAQAESGEHDTLVLQPAGS
jgi:penicillin amidase